MCTRFNIAIIKQYFLIEIEALIVAAFFFSIYRTLLYTLPHLSYSFLRHSDLINPFMRSIYLFFDNGTSAMELGIGGSGAKYSKVGGHNCTRYSGEAVSHLFCCKKG